MGMPDCGLPSESLVSRCGAIRNSHEARSRPGVVSADRGAGIELVLHPFASSRRHMIASRITEFETASVQGSASGTDENHRT